MKKAILGVMILLPTLAMAQDAYKAKKRIIDNSTRTRISAARNGDYEKVCNATHGSHGSDTKVYYQAFELFNTRETAIQLTTDLGPFYARVLESMHRKSLPYKLHSACMSGNLTELKNVMASMESEMMLENVE